MKSPICVVFALVLTIQLANGSARAQTPDKQLDDRLLLWVAKQHLRDSGFRCVRQFDPAARPPRARRSLELEFHEVSPWLLQRLRREQSTLRHCGPADSFDPKEELWIGPVVWRQPSKEADVHFGFPNEVIGQEGYYARRGRFGRWHFTPMIRE